MIVVVVVVVVGLGGGVGGGGDVGLLLLRDCEGVVDGVGVGDCDCGGCGESGGGVVLALLGHGGPFWWRKEDEGGCVGGEIGVVWWCSALYLFD